MLVLFIIDHLEDDLTEASGLLSHQSHRDDCQRCREDGTHLGRIERAPCDGDEPDLKPVREDEW